MFPSTLLFGFIIVQWRITNSVHSNDFTILTKSAYFIDKSEMIKVFFDPRKALHHFITCPRGFGKSVNLQMLKLFANIVVDKNGSEVNYKQTEVFDVFRSLKIVKLYQGSDFIQRHMVQYPIVHLKLGTKKTILEIRDEDDIVSYLNDRLNSCFKDYEWLLQIPQDEFIRRTKSNLYIGLKDIVFMEKLYQKNLNKSEAIQGLRSLCRILYLYFDKKVIVLVDQYDHMINSYAIWNSNQTVNQMYSAINTMLHLAVNSIHFVDNWIITGASSMPFRGSYLTFSNFNHHSFLNEHLFTPYYGFSENEMKQLFSKFKCSMEEKIDIKEYYNGYVTKGTQTPMYNPYSVTKYFSARNAADRKHSSHALKSYWRIGDDKEFLLKLLRHLPGFKLDMNKLIARDSISFKLTKNFFKKDLRIFHDLKIIDKNLYIKHYDLAMSFLFENGYLVPTLRKINEYQIPNNEISLELDVVLEEFKTKKSKNSEELDYSLLDLSLCEDDDDDNNDSLT